MGRKTKKNPSYKISLNEMPVIYWLVSVTSKMAAMVTVVVALNLFIFPDTTNEINY